MLSRRNKYFLDLCHSQRNLNRSWHHLLEKIRSVLHKGKHQELMASITWLRKQGILGSKSKESYGQKARCALALEKKNPCVTSTFHRLVGKAGCKAVKYIDLSCLKGEQLLMNVG